jgi:hypothetical protein
VAGISAALAVASIGLLLGFLRVNRRRTRTAVRFTEVQQRDGDVMGYVVTYLLPFLSTNYYANGSVDVANVLSIALLFAVIITIYVNANLIFINPTLSLAGYRIYEIEIADSGQKKALLTRRTAIPSSGTLTLIPLGSFIFWDPSS